MDLRKEKMLLGILGFVVGYFVSESKIVKKVVDKVKEVLKDENSTKQGEETNGK